MSSAVPILLSIVAGGLLSLVYLCLVWLSAATTIHQRSLLPVGLGYALRLLFLISMLAMLVRLRVGPVSLISGLTGFLAVRSTVLLCCRYRGFYWLARTS